jgi:DNA repair exonuclease SbcCD ATPase subunit
LPRLVLLRRGQWNVQRMRRDDLEKRMQTLVERRAETERELREAEARLAEIEDERNELSGRLALRRRAVEDFAQYERQLRDDMAAVALEEAHAAVTAAIEARDVAVGDAAKKASELRSAHDLLEQRRRELVDAVDALRRLRPPSKVSVPAEPETFEEEWRSVVPLVEQELNRRLESELVAQAARSNNPLDIESLPAHLQALAKERRNQERRLKRGTLSS